MLGGWATATPPAPCPTAGRPATRAPPGAPAPHGWRRRAADWHPPESSVRLAFDTSEHAFHVVETANPTRAEVESCGPEGLPRPSRPVDLIEPGPEHFVDE